MESYEVQLKDFKKAEQELTGKERVFISQDNNTRSTTIDEIRKPLAEQLNENTQSIETANNNISNLDSKKASKEELAKETTDRKTSTDALNSRVNELTKLTEGSTTGDAELVDGRIDFKGNVHANIGDSIRKVTEEFDYNCLSVPNNLATSGDIITGKYIGKAGLLNDSDSSIYSISIDTNKKYILGIPVKKDSDYIVFKNDVGATAGISYDDLETYNLDRNTGLVGFVIDATKYKQYNKLCVTKKLANFWVRDIYLVELNDYISLRELAKNTFNKVLDIKDEIVNNTGKDIIWGGIGDSLTDTSVAPNKKYGEMIAEETGCTFYNYGKAGHGYVNGEFYITEMAKWFDLKCNVVTMMGSINDVGQLTLGNITDTTRDTLAGCINEAITNIFNRKATVKLGIISPLPNKIYYGTNDNALEKIVKLQKSICENRGIPYLDLYHCGGLMTNHADFCTQFMQDETHFNEEGQRYFKNKIKNFIFSL